MRVEPDGSLFLGFNSPDASSTAKGLFYFMAVSLVFEDDSNETQKLELFINNKNRCCISTGQLDSEYYNGWCTLDSNDLTVLISELKSIKTKIDENER